MFHRSRRFPTSVAGDWTFDGDVPELSLGHDAIKDASQVGRNAPETNQPSKIGRDCGFQDGLSQIYVKLGDSATMGIDAGCLVQIPEIIWSDAAS